MKIKEVTDVIERFAPLAWQESYDNAGLIVGRPDDEVHKALLAVDVTDEVMDEAEREGCDLVVTHHPIVFHALKRFNSADPVQRCVERAIRRGIALYACHTNLDSAPGGMSWRLAEMLGVGNLRVLQPSPVAAVVASAIPSVAPVAATTAACAAMDVAMPAATPAAPIPAARTDVTPSSVITETATPAAPAAGFGVVGELPAAEETAAFMRRMQRLLGVRVVRHSDIASEKVRRVAVCTGAGASLIGDARRAGADIYVTADMKYNDFMTPDKALTVADIGHFESEYCAIDLLFDILSKNLCTFAVRKSEDSRNPVNYLV